MKQVLLDVDGVVADLLSHIIDTIGSNASPSDAISFRFEDWLSPKEALLARQLMESPEFWMTIPTMPGAEKGVQKIRDRNHEITWVTAPYRSCPLWNTAREFWLKKHFNVDPHDIIPTDKKHRVSGDIFIDDKHSNVETWEKVQGGRGVAYLMTAPHNARVIRTHRVTWDTIDQVI